MEAVSVKFEETFTKDFAIVVDDMGRRFRFLNIFSYTNYSSEEDYLNAARRSFNREGQRHFLLLIF